MDDANFIVRNNCPACASSKLRLLYENKFEEYPIKEYLESFYSSRGGVEFEYLKDGTYRLMECENCNLIFQSEILNDSNMKRLYENWINPDRVFKTAKNIHDLRYYAYNAQEIMQIIDYLQKRPSELDFFDFGMGWGNWALMAKAFGCNSYGTDLSEERIKHAESSGLKVISWEEIPDYKFDLINSEQVFEHIPQPLETLKHLKRL